MCHSYIGEFPISKNKKIVLFIVSLIVATLIKATETFICSFDESNIYYCEKIISEEDQTIYFEYQKEDGVKVIESEGYEEESIWP